MKCSAKSVCKKLYATKSFCKYSLQSVYIDCLPSLQEATSELKCKRKAANSSNLQTRNLQTHQTCKPCKTCKPANAKLDVAPVPPARMHAWPIGDCETNAKAQGHPLATGHAQAAGAAPGGARGVHCGLRGAICDFFSPSSYKQSLCCTSGLHAHELQC